MIFFVHTDVLCRLSCSMSLTVLHTWHVVLKHFPCLCKMAFLFVFIMERGGGGWILVHKWGSGLYCFLYAILMYNLSVSVLSNWVKWCFNVHSNFFVHLYWLLWSWMHVYRIEIDISIIYLSARAKYIAIYFFSQTFNHISIFIFNLNYNFIFTNMQTCS